MTQSMMATAALEIMQIFIYWKHSTFGSK